MATAHSVSIPTRPLGVQSWCGFMTHRAGVEQVERTNTRRERLTSARWRSASDCGACCSEVIHDVDVLTPLSRPGGQHKILARCGGQ